LNIGEGLALAGSETLMVKKSREMPWSSAAPSPTAPCRSLALQVRLSSSRCWLHRSNS
jgi:hypothetical protein